MKRPILSGRPAPTRPFVRSEFREGADRSPAEYRLYFRPGRAVGDAQSERNLLRTKGMRKDWLIS